MRSARSFQRQRRRLKVTLPCGASFTVDISAGGFCTEAMRVLPVGSAVRGTIDYHGKAVAFAGRVAWNTPSDVALSVRGRMGVAFANIHPELLALVLGGSQTAGAGML